MRGGRRGGRAARLDVALLRDGLLDDLSVLAQLRGHTIDRVEEGGRAGGRQAGGSRQDEGARPAPVPGGGPGQAGAYRGVPRHPSGRGDSRRRRGSHGDEADEACPVGQRACTACAVGGSRYVPGMWKPASVRWPAALPLARRSAAWSARPAPASSHTAPAPARLRSGARGPLPAAGARRRGRRASAARNAAGDGGQRARDGGACGTCVCHVERVWSVWSSYCLPAAPHALDRATWR